MVGSLMDGLPALRPALLGLFLCGLDDALGLRLGRRVVPAARDGVLQIAPDDGDALDQLGQALDRAAT